MQRLIPVTPGGRPRSAATAGATVPTGVPGRARAAACRQASPPGPALVRPRLRLTSRNERLASLKSVTGSPPSRYAARSAQDRNLYAFSNTPDGDRAARSAWGRHKRRRERCRCAEESQRIERGQLGQRLSAACRSPAQLPGTAPAETGSWPRHRGGAHGGNGVVSRLRGDLRMASRISDQTWALSVRLSRAAGAGCRIRGRRWR